MHFVHQNQILHRDLKPGNILLGSDGTPKVADFGLAKVLDDDLGYTPSGEALGTPSYMAPEQVLGQRRKIAPPTDVYGLGAILYEMLAGGPPFKGLTRQETMNAVLSQDPPLPSRRAGSVPRDLETICLKCLEKEPERRYASAAELAEDLDRFLARRSIHARRPSLGQRLAKFGRRNKILVRSAAVVAVIAVVSLIGIGTVFRWFQQERTQRERTGAEKHFSDAQAAMNQGRWLDALENLELALAGRVVCNDKVFTELKEAVRLNPQEGATWYLYTWIRFLRQSQTKTPVSMAKLRELESEFFACSKGASHVQREDHGLGFRHCPGGAARRENATAV